MKTLRRVCASTSIGSDRERHLLRAAADCHLTECFREQNCRVSARQLYCFW